MNWERVHQFLQEIEKTHSIYRNPFMNQQWVIDELGLIELWDDGVENQLDLSYIVSFDMGKGSGSKLLDIVCETADALGWTLALTAKVVGEHKDRLRQVQLEKWYRSRGFRRSNKGTYIKRYVR